MFPDYVFLRPNGKPYRPRSTSLTAHSWGDVGEEHGCVIIGTLNADEAQPFANQSLAHWCEGPATNPQRGWYRLAIQRGEPTWICDDLRGRPGVMFTCEGSC